MPTAEQFRAAFAPLDEADRRDVARFIRKVDALERSSFMRERIGLGGELIPGATHLGGPAWSISVDLPDEESVKAVIADFRILYTDTNQCSAIRVLKLLSGSAKRRGTPQGDAVIEAFRVIRRQLNGRRAEDPVGKILDAEPDGTMVERRPGDIVDLWFNGEYFHDDRDLADELEPADGIDVQMLRLSLHNAMRDHINAWIVIRNTARGVLDAYSG